MGQKKRFEPLPEPDEEELSFEMEMDEDFSYADSEELPEDLPMPSAVRDAGWRRIEQLREQRLLQMQLEDFDQYVV
ncbi:MAG: hypothetical protein D6727_10005 [Gammaproteobacteria bacterium]|nr:MAG: hypothetical protein D6727_10005 [Gammaproteobacteria bacterium]